MCRREWLLSSLPDPNTTLDRRFPFPFEIRWSFLTSSHKSGDRLDCTNPNCTIRSLLELNEFGFEDELLLLAILLKTTLHKRLRLKVAFHKSTV
jgi:hypothetical protein